MRVVILGATSHIAKGLIDRFLQRGGQQLCLFSRSPDNVRQFLESIGQVQAEGVTICGDYRDFSDGCYDVIINSIGVETRNSHNCDFTRYFTVTEEFDNLSINYLKNHNPNALYISFSSGAVYGRGFSEPVDEFSRNCLPVNQLQPEDYYGIVRIHAEAKHRAHPDLRIIDLRIFSYFSRYINLTDGYFITDVMEAILNDTLLITDSNNIVRDYLHPDDLFSMIVRCIQAGRINQAFDVSSISPVSKREILEYFTSEYGLRYESRRSSFNASATGAKTNYYSTCKQATRIGYMPRHSSMDSLKLESELILSRCQHSRKELVQI
ncbi:MAG: NAD(P)-dependent oxidoreductase [Desulfuromonadales bacterium]|nr:NAD(P)-dependent oxidoreductase [Desulfuromonadales bacterium]